MFKRRKGSFQRLYNLFSLFNKIFIICLEIFFYTFFLTKIQQHINNLCNSLNIIYSMENCFYCYCQFVAFLKALTYILYFSNHSISITQQSSQTKEPANSNCICNSSSNRKSINNCYVQ